MPRPSFTWTPQGLFLFSWSLLQSSPTLLLCDFQAFPLMPQTLPTPVRVISFIFDSSIKTYESHAPSLRRLFSSRCSTENQRDPLLHPEVFAADDSSQERGL